MQMLEFIDDEGTPKNLMIRAVKKGGGAGKCTSAVKGAASDKETSSVEGGGAKKSSCRILQELGVRQTLEELLTGSISE